MPANYRLKILSNMTRKDMRIRR